jgi:hypothetical protein
MMRPNPASSLVRRSSPIASMPLVMSSYGVPVAFDPYELRIRPYRLNQDHASRGWRAD